MSSQGENSSSSNRCSIKEGKELRKSGSDLNLVTKHGRIREYEIIRELGRGAYATVYQAKKDTDKKDYALKVLDKLFLTKVIL